MDDSFAGTWCHQRKILVWLVAKVVMTFGGLVGGRKRLTRSATQGLSFEKALGLNGYGMEAIATVEVGDLPFHHCMGNKTPPKHSTSPSRRRFG